MLAFRIRKTLSDNSYFCLYAPLCSFSFAFCIFLAQLCVCLGEKNKWCILCIILFIWRWHATFKTNYVNPLRFKALISFMLLLWMETEHSQEKGLKGSMARGQLELCCALRTEVAAQPCWKGCVVDSVCPSILSAWLRWYPSLRIWTSGGKAGCVCSACRLLTWTLPTKYSGVQAIELCRNAR